MRSLGAALAAAALGLALAGCQAADSSPQRTAPRASASLTAPSTDTATSDTVTPAIEVWRAERGVPLSPIVGAGDVGVYYAERHREIVVVALDLRTGRELWSRSGPSTQPYDARPTVTASGDVAVVLDDAGRMSAAGLDPRTGRILWTSPPADSAALFRGCTSDPDQLCVRLDGKDWRVGSDGALRRAPMRDGMVVNFDGRTLSGVEDGHARWVTWMDHLRKHWTVFNAWFHPQHDRYLLEVVRRTNDLEIKASGVGVMALDAADGHVVWTHRSARFCPLVIPEDRIRVADEGPRFQTLCVYRGGTVHNPRLRGTSHFDLDGTDYMGIDLVTGKQVWRRFASSGMRGSGPTSSDGTEVYLHRATGDQLIEMGTGAVRTVPDDYISWVQDVSVASRGASASTRVERTGIFAPQRSGRRAEELFWPLPEHLGAIAGDVHAITTADAVVGYRAGITSATPVLKSP